MAVEAPPGRMEQARAGMRRAALKRQVEAVAAGSGDRLPIDLEDGAFDVATVVAEVAWPLQPQSASLTRLVVALHRSGVADAVVAGLAEEDPLQLERCCRILGALRLEPAVPWLAPLLRSEHVAVSDRAARALGRLGGIRSAEALLAATRRAGTRRPLVAAKALGELHAQAQFKELDLLLTDRDPRVRKAAKQSLLRLGNVMLSRDWRWAWR